MLRQSAYLEELERTVALLAFEDCSSSPLRELMGTAHRQQIAAELNAAILHSQNHEMGTPATPPDMHA